MALVEVTAATHSSAPPPRSRSRARRASTPGRDVHALGGQPVKLQQPPPGPDAGRDDAAAAAERRAPGARDLVGAVGGGREPSGMCTRTTRRSRSRLRHEHLGGRRGDQAVEQHDGAIGDRRTTPARAARRGRVARARSRELRARSDRPAERARGRRRRGGHRCCPRWAGRDRRRRRARRHAPLFHSARS